MKHEVYYTTTPAANMTKGYPATDDYTTQYAGTFDTYHEAEAKASAIYMQVRMDNMPRVVSTTVQKAKG